MATSIREITDFEATGLVERLAAEPGPVVMRGVAAHWPLVQKSWLSNREADAYLRDAYEGASVTAFFGDAETDGRIFYTEGLADTNFRQISTDMGRVLDEIRDHAEDEHPPVVYMGSMALSHCLPGIKGDNSLLLEGVDATIRIWIGNRSRIAAHYDVLENIACVCTGRRRFTLFPPDQLENLYVGPIDFTPAGQPISLVDLHEPDFERFPRFAEALQHAQSAELGPGDAVYIPSMWWHHVEGLDPFNVLINHWWLPVPSYLGAPHDALLHALLSIRALPAEQRGAWRRIFEHYVFAPQDDALAHIPEGRRGVLGKLDADGARKLRAILRNNLNR